MNRDPVNIRLVRSCFSSFPLGVDPWKTLSERLSIPAAEVRRRFAELLKQKQIEKIGFVFNRNLSEKPLGCQLIISGTMTELIEKSRELSQYLFINDIRICEDSYGKTVLLVTVHALTTESLEQSINLLAEFHELGDLEIVNLSRIYKDEGFNIPESG